MLRHTFRLTIRAKLFAGFGAILALLGIVAVVAVVGMAEMNSRATEIIDNRIPALYHAEEATSALLDTRENMMSLVLQEEQAKRDADLADFKAASARFD